MHPLGREMTLETLCKVLGYLTMYDPMGKRVPPTPSYEHCPTEGKDSVLPSR